MNYRGWVVVSCCAVMFGWVSAANAVLIDNEDGTVTMFVDNVPTLMWLKRPWSAPDPNPPEPLPVLDWPRSDLAWKDAMNWVESYVFAGYDDWRLPSALTFGETSVDTDPGEINNEFGYLYGVELGVKASGNYPDSIAPLEAYSDQFFWTGTIDGDDAAYRFLWTAEQSWQLQYFDDIESLPHHITAVRDIPPESRCDFAIVNPDCAQQIPEPDTTAILGLGLAGIFLARRRKKFSLTFR